MFSSIWPIDRTLSGVTIPGQSGPGSDCNEGILCPSITGASPPDCLVPYPRHSLAESYPIAEMQSMYSLPPADCAQSLKATLYLQPCAKYKLHQVFSDASRDGMISKLR